MAAGWNTGDKRSFVTQKTNGVWSALGVAIIFMPVVALATAFETGAAQAPAPIVAVGPETVVWPGQIGEKCKAHTRGRVRRMVVHGNLQRCIGKEISRFKQGKDDFTGNIDDVCIHYDGGRVAANESLKAEITANGLRKTTKQTGIDRKTIRGILNGKRVRAPTLAKVVIGLRQE